MKTCKMVPSKQDVYIAFEPSGTRSTSWPFGLSLELIQLFLLSFFKFSKNVMDFPLNVSSGIAAPFFHLCDLHGIAKTDKT